MVGAFGFHPRSGLVDGGRLGQPHERRTDPRGHLGFRQFASVPILNKLLQDYGITPAARSQIMPRKPRSRSGIRRSMR